ncbi:MAG: RagB/SusD family nutrient uptake outer membrane protein [Bacteroidales bacterium]|nr:RagB/SusD family nutrient uptake outer membrane protein [Bacteroidales bacterium]
MNKQYKIPKWFVTCLLAYLAVSCERDFLDKQPLLSISTETFWTSKEDVETALTGVYSRLQEDFLGYQRIYFEGLSDNIWVGSGSNFNQPNLYQMTIGGLTPALTGALQNMYNTPYSVISGCNYFLDNLDKAKEYLEEKELDIYKAEVRFIRALAYFDLVRLFGGVVVYRNFVKTIDDAKIAKSPEADVYAFIEEDLNFAISKLPDTRYIGHAVKGSAQGILGRVLLTQEKWAAAADTLKKIIDGGKFSLSNSYSDLFLTAGQNVRNGHPEIMFSTRYLAPDNIHSDMNGMDVEIGLYLLMQAYDDLADSYQMTDGLPADESPLFDGTDSITRYANRDPRLDMTLRLPGEVWTNPSTGDTVVDDEVLYTGFVMEKYLDLSRAPFERSATSAQSDQDLVHLRYADVLLMYAEARNEATGPDATVYAALDEVRGRTGVDMPPMDQARYDAKESLRELIRNERRVELALEGHRYFDLKRWKIAREKLNGMELPGGATMVFRDENYYLPFPQEEIDRNPKLLQNDGY